MSNEQEQNFVKLYVVSGVLVVVMFLGMFFIYPMYNVWVKEMRGKASLKEAEWSRQILVEEASARQQAAINLAQAEVERAKGVAEANRIIGESLNENEAYLRYLWIQGLNDGSSEVIYIPTEANLPILEARNKEQE